AAIGSEGDILEASLIDSRRAQGKRREHLALLAGVPQPKVELVPFLHEGSLHRTRGVEYRGQVRPLHLELVQAFSLLDIPHLGRGLVIVRRSEDQAFAVRSELDVRSLSRTLERAQDLARKVGVTHRAIRVPQDDPSITDCGKYDRMEVLGRHR